MNRAIRKQLPAAAEETFAGLFTRPKSFHALEGRPEFIDALVAERLSGRSYTLQGHFDPEVYKTVANEIDEGSLPSPSNPKATKAWNAGRRALQFKI